MKREPMVFAVAGMIFGFVLGYMVANVGERPAARPTTAGLPTAASGGDAAETGPGAERSHPAPVLDPDELRALESLARKDKANAQVRVDLANLLMDHARYEEAVRWYREAVALQPSNPDVLVDLGACLVNLGKASEALEEFERALRADPAHKKALFNKGIALTETGRTREAVAVWEGLLKRYPDDPQLRGLREQIDQVRAQKARSAS